MKTSTTQKVGLATAVLVLLAIISADYYYNGRRDLSPKESVASTASRTIPTVPDNTNSVLNNTGNNSVADNTPVDDYLSARAKNRHSYRHNRGKIISESTPVSDNYIRTADYNGIAANTPKKPELIIHETSKDHYAYTPADNDVVSKLHRVHLGIEGGYNQNSFSQNNTSNLQRNGFHAGGIVDIGFGNHFSLQPGLMYTLKGNRTQSTLDVYTNEKLSLNYLELPINMVFKIGHVGDARFLIGVGPYLSYLLSARDNFQNGNPDDGTVVDIPGYVAPSPYYNTNNIQRFDYGVGGFIGAEIPEGLYVKAGGELGLRNIEQNSMNGAYMDRNYNFQLSVGFLFGYEK